MRGVAVPREPTRPRTGGPGTAAESKGLSGRAAIFWQWNMLEAALRTSAIRLELASHDPSQVTGILYGNGQIPSEMIDIFNSLILLRIAAASDQRFAPTADQISGYSDATSLLIEHIMRIEALPGEER